WVQFRAADTLWRSEAATETADSTKYDQAQHALETLVRDVVREEDKDRVWVEVQESLGDFYWVRRDSRNWSAAWEYYNKALDWWAGSDQLDIARDRYIGIVWRIARPAWVEPYYYYGYYGNTVPLDVLQNVLKIAKSENDIAHAHYLIAMTLRYQGGNYDQRQRIPEEFEAALKAGKTTDWYDDALFYYAEWLSQYGRVFRTPQGQWMQEPDFVRALELYRRLLAEHVKGESRYYDQAGQRIKDITSPVVGISVSNIFLPDSEIQYSLNWRNTKRVDLALYKVDLTRDVKFGGDNSGGNWLQQIHVNENAKVKAWFKDTGDKGDYRPGQEWMHLDEKPAPGAYVIEAKSGTLTARDLILITDTSLVVKTSGKMALFYFCNALNGSPVSSATIAVWEKFYDGSNYQWRQASATTNQDGLATLELHSKTSYNSELFAAAIQKDRQAFSTGSSYSNGGNTQPWRIYAFTDRPAYRPGEKAQWKFTARQYNGSVYSTPANQTLEYEIYDPRGTKINEGKAKLNAFGSAWGSADLTEAMPLGEYRITFYDEGRNNSIGGATLFRVEEYKLPEFKATIQTPEENGRKKTFRVGDSVQVNVQADYYFGGAVTNANVEVIVYQNPFYQWWHRPYDYPWYYEDMISQPRNWYGSGSIVKRETLKTDAEGKAVLTFETPANSGQDFEYRVEARVTDASRREITATNTVRVTRQSYYVYPDSEHYLYRPQDKVQINIKAIDANSQPVQIEGTVKLTRDVWYEIWLDPNGKEVKGDELKQLRDRMGMFPPAPGPGEQPWRLKFQGYQHDDILTRPVKTDANGEAQFTFTPERDGYYRVAWSSEDKGAAPITAETAVWVATNATTELGYRHGGLEIIVDKDTFRAGQTAPVMLSVPTSDRYVLFTTEAEDLMGYQLIHMTGTVKLIELPIEEKHVPNFFLGGVMVSDRQIFSDSKQVVVPPVKNFLQVDVAADRAQYQPQEEGTLTVTTKDADGKPVAAEVALGLVDESVFYIQQDYAGDPRPFYFGEKRGLAVQT
ncbi:MAG TPA: MG2 domain-containing protein, partial [Acidobacteriota bacterium]|nr:MG2 domain-containing protein [Acidobacteriota bacterium]